MCLMRLWFHSDRDFNSLAVRLSILTSKSFYGKTNNSRVPPSTSSQWENCLFILLFYSNSNPNVFAFVHSREFLMTKSQQMFVDKQFSDLYFVSSLHPQNVIPRASETLPPQPTSPATEKKEAIFQKCFVWRGIQFLDSMNFPRRRFFFFCFIFE